MVLVNEKSLFDYFANCLVVHQKKKKPNTLNKTSITTKYVKTSKA